MFRALRTPTRRALLAAAVVAVLIGAGARPGSSPAAEAQAPIGNLLQPPSLLVGLTANNRLVLFLSILPGNALFSVPITGLVSPDEVIVAIDVRPATGQLYALSSASRLYTVNPYTGFATPVGSGPFTPALQGNEFGFDFNPAVDLIRVVSNSGQNLRLNPDTGAVVGEDGRLRYAPGDPNAGRTPRIVGAAYSNNVAGATSTTLYEIDAGLDILVTQGTAAGSPNPVSPNTGQLFTVGPLGVDTLERVGFDIAPNGRAFASLTSPFNGSTSLYSINLATGAATLIGPIGGDQPLRGLAVIR